MAVMVDRRWDGGPVRCAWRRTTTQLSADWILVYSAAARTASTRPRTDCLEGGAADSAEITRICDRLVRLCGAKGAAHNNQAGVCPRSVVPWSLSVLSTVGLNACDIDPALTALWPKTEALDCRVLHCPTWISAAGPVLTFSSNIALETGSTGFVEGLVRLQAEAAGDDFLLDLGGAAEDRHDRLWVGRLSRRQRVLAVHEEDLAGDQVAVQGSPRQIPRRKASLLWWNAREPFQHWSRYYSQVERPYPWRSDDGAVSLQESRGDPR